MDNRPRTSFLYVSRLTPGLDVSTVGSITRRAREDNAIAGITGLLVFNGEAFAQFVEGPAEAIQRLQARIERDPRHQDIQVLSTGAVTGDRRFPGRGLGYLIADIDTGGIEQLRKFRGPAALAAFVDLMPIIDVETGTALPV